MNEDEDQEKIRDERNARTVKKAPMITTYLVFGDLHGRILPAFRLAAVWSRETRVEVAGLLQVGDLGYFPDPSRLDKATKAHAAKDPLELGASLVAQPSREADAILLGEDHLIANLWATLGNHEDYEAIADWDRAADRRAASFAIDAYARVRCIRNGQVVELLDGLRIGALWGIDAEAPNARPRTPAYARIADRAAYALAASRFDVLLTHESPRDAVYDDSGSVAINLILEAAQPAFAFFGHYSGAHGRIEAGPRCVDTRIHHMAGFEMRAKGSTAEPGSVGLLRWDGENRSGSFEYLDEAWLRTFTRHNWRHR